MQKTYDYEEESQVGNDAAGNIQKMHDEYLSSSCCILSTLEL